MNAWMNVFLTQAVGNLLRPSARSAIFEHTEWLCEKGRQSL